MALAAKWSMHIQYLVSFNVGVGNQALSSTFERWGSVEAASEVW